MAPCAKAKLGGEGERSSLSSTLTMHLQHYLELSRNGRARVMKTETATVKGAVAILEKLCSCTLYALHSEGHEHIFSCSLLQHHARDAFVVVGRISR